MSADEPAEDITVKGALERFLEDCAARRLSSATLSKYRFLAGEVGTAWGKLDVRGVNSDDVGRLREKWQLAPLTTRKKLEWLRMFFKFCEARDWVRRNPARFVKSPLVKLKPTFPYSDEEMEKIMWAVDAFSEIHPKTPPETQRKLKALILVMRHSGIRISDAVTLKRDRIKGGKLFLYQAKTGTPVWIPVPKQVTDALRDCDDGNPYFFWSGIGKLKSMLTEWQERLKKVFVIAGIPDGHGHRFRDTFACALLLAGVPITEVSILLGHASVSVTEKHYAPWVRARQERLEELVTRTWITRASGH